MVVIGAGRVGGALVEAAGRAGLAVELVTREGGDAALSGEAPILVATRNDDLDAVVQRVPAWRRRDLVFLQNGALREWLIERGLSQCTRGLLYFAVRSRGGPIEPGGVSPFCGPHAAEVARWFAAAGIPAQPVPWPTFTVRELDKLMWNAIFGLLCQRFDADVGTVCKQHEDAIIGLVHELSRVGRAVYGVEPHPGRTVQRLVDYSMSISDYRGSVKEWRWRNGWFVQAARRYGLACPLHEDLLRTVGLGEKLDS